MLYLAVRNNSLKCFQVNFKPCFACIGASNITSFGKVKYPVWRNNPIRRIFHINSVMCCPFWFVFNYIAAHLKNIPIFNIHHQLSFNQPLLKHHFTFCSITKLKPIKRSMAFKTKGNYKGITGLNPSTLTMLSTIWVCSLAIGITAPYTRQFTNLSESFWIPHLIVLLCRVSVYSLCEVQHRTFL